MNLFLIFFALFAVVVFADEDQGVVADAVDTVGDVAGGAADVVDGTVKKAFSIGGGGIVGIIIGCLILIGICIGIVWCFRKAKSVVKKDGDDVADDIEEQAQA